MVLGVSFSLLATVLAATTALILLVSRDWRVSISALGAQYAGVFILVGLIWPLEYAVVKLVTGWIAAAVLGISLVENPDEWKQKTEYGISGMLFRFFLAGLIILVIFSLSFDVDRWLPRVAREQLLGGLLLIGLGLLHLGLTSRPTRVMIGLLTVFSGFELLFAQIEASLLVNAFLAAITLGIALVGSYLLIAPQLEPES